MVCVAGIILAFILFSVGVLIGWNGIQKIVAGNYDALIVPGVLALVAAIVSIVVKETHDVAKQVHDDIETKFPNVKHCMVHRNPFSIIAERAADT